MDTIELLKDMQEKCLHGRYEDSSKKEKFQALEEAIKSLQNQPKIAEVNIDAAKLAASIMKTWCMSHTCDDCFLSGTKTLCDRPIRWNGPGIRNYKQGVKGEE